MELTRDLVEYATRLGWRHDRQRRRSRTLFEYQSVTDQSAGSTYSLGVRPPVADDRYRATHQVPEKPVRAGTGCLLGRLCLSHLILGQRRGTTLLGTTRTAQITPRGGDERIDCRARQ